MTDIVDLEKKHDLESVAYEQMKMAIVQGVYPPGFQIVEEMIANQLNMSRSPVRIAIKRLQAEGFLEKHANRRMYVTLADSKRTLDALYVRKALEGIASYQAALNRREKDVMNIRRLLKEMDQWKDGGEDVFHLYKMTVNIHRLIYAAANNPQLERIGVNALEQESVFSYRSLVLDHSRIINAYSEHTSIAQAIIDQNADLAEFYAREHIDQLILRVQNASREGASNGQLLLSSNNR